MDFVTRKELIVLIEAAKSDKDFDETERDLIYKIASQKNVSKLEVDDLLTHTEPIGTLGALSSSQKFSYLVNAAQLMKADGKILDSEILFCEGLAIKMGLKKSIIKLFIDYDGLDEDALWREFNKFI